MADDVIGPMFEDLAGDAGKYGEQAARQLGDTVEGAAERSDAAISEVTSTETDAAKSLDDLAPKEDEVQPPEPAGPGSDTPAVEGPPWPVGEDVPGTAAGKSLKPPHWRHTVSGAKGGEVKPVNTIILRGYEDSVKGDVKGIADGEATWNPSTSRYEINGRTYGVEGNGTVFPDSGTGLAKLDRNEYAALKELGKAGGNPDDVIPFQKAPRFVNNPDAVNKAIAIYQGTYSE
ncbi:MAG TPA: hypothetical protein VJ914_26510 [Pseudonocardiaceae bacterium]|nr:hypothetical protein [Pseudonocardiaceae bacterium]